MVVKKGLEDTDNRHDTRYRKHYIESLAMPIIGGDAVERKRAGSLERH
jgi:hypothetical protein